MELIQHTHSRRTCTLCTQSWELRDNGIFWFVVLVFFFFLFWFYFYFMGSHAWAWAIQSSSSTTHWHTLAHSLAWTTNFLSLLKSQILRFQHQNARVTIYVQPLAKSKTSEYSNDLISEKVWIFLSIATAAAATVVAASLRPTRLSTLVNFLVSKCRHCCNRLHALSPFGSQWMWCYCSDVNNFDIIGRDDRQSKLLLDAFDYSRVV